MIDSPGVIGQARVRGHARDDGCATSGKAVGVTGQRNGLISAGLEPLEHGLSDRARRASDRYDHGWIVSA